MFVKCWKNWLLRLNLLFTLYRKPYWVKVRCPFFSNFRKRNRFCFPNNTQYTSSLALNAIRTTNFKFTRLAGYPLIFLSICILPRFFLLTVKNDTGPWRTVREGNREIKIEREKTEAARHLVVLGGVRVWSYFCIDCTGMWLLLWNSTFSTSWRVQKRQINNRWVVWPLLSRRYYVNGNLHSYNILTLNCWIKLLDSKLYFEDSNDVLLQKKKKIEMVIASLPIFPFLTRTHFGFRKEIWSPTS